MPMFTIKTERAITSDFSKTNFVAGGVVQPNTPGQTEPIQTPSAMQVNTDSSVKEEPKWKKSVRAPKAIRRKKMNARLSKLITPKPAYGALMDLLPGSQITYTQSPTTHQFMAEIVHNHEIIGTAVGKDKETAKNTAANAALKKIFTGFMQRSRDGNLSHSENESMETDEEGTRRKERDFIPWFNLAPYALFRMFNEWKAEGYQVPLRDEQEIAAERNVAAANQVRGPPKTELPPNSAEMHPTSLLNYMMPGVRDITLRSTPAPNFTLTVGFNIDGQIYTGTANNRKAARKIAAQAALKAIYGCEFAPETPRIQDL